MLEFVHLILPTQKPILYPLEPPKKEVNIWCGHLPLEHPVEWRCQNLCESYQKRALETKRPFLKLPWPLWSSQDPLESLTWNGVKVEVEKSCSVNVPKYVLVLPYWVSWLKEPFLTFPDPFGPPKAPWTPRPGAVWKRMMMPFNPSTF